MPRTVNVSGRVGNDPELRYLNSGSAVVSFNVACDEYNRESREKETIWCTCKLFGKTAERVGQVVKKGCVVELLAGKIQEREYNGKTYTDHIFSDFAILAFPQGQSQGGGRQRNPSGGDDDIPF